MSMGRARGRRGCRELLFFAAILLLPGPLYALQDERLARPARVQRDPLRPGPEVDGRDGRLLVGEELDPRGAARHARHDPDEAIGGHHRVVDPNAVP